MAKQRARVAELQAVLHLLVVLAAGGFVPGNVGDRMRLQVGLLAHVVQHLAHEAVFAARHPQQGQQQALESLALVIGFDEGRLRLLHGFEHAVLALQRLGREP